MPLPLILTLLPSEEERINDWLLREIKKFNNSDFDTIKESPKEKKFKIKQKKMSFEQVEKLFNNIENTHY